MSLATAVKKSELQLSLPSNFSTDDRTVSRSKNQALYVPQIFLPTKVTIKVKPDSISIKLFYVLDETVTEIVNETKRVLIGKGVNSGRIFYIKASLDKARFATLLNRMQDVRSALKAQRNESKSEVQRKNYELILSLMDRTIQLASQSKDEIEKIFTS